MLEFRQNDEGIRLRRRLEYHNRFGQRLRKLLYQLLGKSVIHLVGKHLTQIVRSHGHRQIRRAQLLQHVGGAAHRHESGLPSSGALMRVEGVNLPPPFLCIALHLRPRGVSGLHIRTGPVHRRHSRDHAAFGHAFGPALKDIPIQRGQQPVHVLVFHGPSAPGHGIHQRMPCSQDRLHKASPKRLFLIGQLACRPFFREAGKVLFHDQSAVFHIPKRINPILVGDGRDFRIAHAAHTLPQPVEHPPFFVHSQEPVQAMMHHILVHPYFRRTCRAVQIVRHEVHRAGSGIVHALQTRCHIAVKLPDVFGQFLKRLNPPRVGGVGRPFAKRVRHPLHRGLADTEACGRHSGQEFAGSDGSHRCAFLFNNHHARIDARGHRQGRIVERAFSQLLRSPPHLFQPVPELGCLLVLPEKGAFAHNGDQLPAGIQQVVGSPDVLRILPFRERRVHDDTVKALSLGNILHEVLADDLVALGLQQLALLRLQLGHHGFDALLPDTVGDVPHPGGRFQNAHARPDVRSRQHFLRHGYGCREKVQPSPVVRRVAHDAALKLSHLVLLGCRLKPHELPQSHPVFGGRLNPHPCKGFPLLPNIKKLPGNVTGSASLLVEQFIDQLGTQGEHPVIIAFPYTALLRRRRRQDYSVLPALHRQYHGLATIAATGNGLFRIFTGFEYGGLAGLCRIGGNLLQMRMGKLQIGFGHIVGNGKNLLPEALGAILLAELSAEFSPTGTVEPVVGEGGKLYGLGGRRFFAVLLALIPCGVFRLVLFPFRHSQGIPKLLDLLFLAHAVKECRGSVPDGPGDVPHSLRQ